MPGPNSSQGRAKPWGRRPYAGKEARELLNDISRYIFRTDPDDVDDASDPALCDVLRHAGPALNRDDSGADPKASALAGLMDYDLTFQEAVCWYWFRYCQFDLTEIHYAIDGRDTGGDPEQRRNATRNILRTLEAAASKVPGEDPNAIPDLVDDRKRHDRGITAVDWDELSDALTPAQLRDYQAVVVEGKAYDEQADAVDATSNTIRSNVSRARQSIDDAGLDVDTDTD